MHAPLESPALWGIILNIVLQWVDANLCLGFKVAKHQEESTKGTAKSISVNCQVGNTTYAHGQIFKLDCKTQCVCENGRHACSSLCPKEQLPAPENTLSCRSPRLVEVPGHCCKMWFCENPTADVYATCHNSTESPWTPCSNVCGLGISTRFTRTAYGCSQLSNVRLCNNRKCTTTDGSRGDFSPNNNNHISSEFKIWQHLNRNNVKRNRNYLKKQHRIRKGHECRSIQRLGPSRVRLGECVSRKVYRPKLCGRCHDKRKCCVPSASTTIQVELLCPLNVIDPITYIQQHQQNNTRQFSSATTSMTSSPSLWDAHTHERINQEFLQSHQIQMKNKFIAVEWILKCECRKNKHCLKNFGSNNINTELITNLKKANINSKYKRYDDSELNNEQNYDNASNDIEPQIVSNKKHLNEFNRRLSISDNFQSYHIQNPLLFTLRIPKKHYDLKKSHNDVDEMAMSRKTSQPLKIKHNEDKKIYYRLPPHEVEMPRKQQHYYHKHHPQKP